MVLTKTSALSPQPSYTKTGMIWHFMKGCVRFFLISILASFIYTLLELLIPQIIRQFVDCVIGTEAFSVPSFVLDKINALGGAGYFRANLWFMAVLVGLMATVAAVFRYITTQTNSVAAEHLQRNMREELFAHLQRLPFSWYMKHKTGDIVQRCTSDVERIRNFIADQLTSVLRIIILICLSLYFMFSMNPRLAAVSAAMIPIIIFYSTYFRSKIADRFQLCDTNEGILSAIVQENLTGVRVVRAFGRETYEKERFDKQNRYYTSLWVGLMRLLALFWGVGDLFSALQILLVMVFGTKMCVAGTMTVGEFIAFMTYNSMLVWPVRALGRVISEMSKAGVSIDRVRYIMNSPEEHDKKDAVSTETTRKALRGDIVFNDVTFGYEENVPIVDHVSFTIKSGTTFGILGSTGSGKSTLMHLLDRLYDLGPDGGSITIGGVNIADMKAEDLRRGIGIVLQEPFLFSRTIGENISITNRTMSQDEIRRAASIACINDTISSFSKGYDTMVGERGVTLSGGQKQRTAIARMLTQQAPIMIFDDSLSAVDAETDAEIRHQLHENLSSSTVILISHRVTTLMRSSCIMVMDKGRIVEMGTPEQLLAKGGVYKRIYDMQLSLDENSDSLENFSWSGKEV